MLKKPTTNFLLSCSTRHGLHGPAPIFPSKSHTQNQHLHSHINTSNSQSYEKKIRWPEVASANSTPTPYEIFNQEKSSPYSKKRFYELVKLYHPDRHDLNTKISGLSYETKLERYRLIVAANNILGDPVRRNAYDRYGAGWDGKPDAFKSSHHTSRTTGNKEWYEGPDGPSQNATWEDWERWYGRDGPQDTNFVSNAAFVGIILTFALLGGIGQVTRAGNYSMNFLEQRDALHDRVAKELAQIKKESSKYQFQEERIQRFMKSRDASSYAGADSQNESLRKITRKSSEICPIKDNGEQENHHEQRREFQNE